MFSLLILLSLQVLPDFNNMSPISFSCPADWSSDCSSVDKSGRIIAGCSRWNTDIREHEVLLFIIGESVDTVMIDDERITGLISVCPASEGGFFVTFPSEFHSEAVSAARLNADGSLDWCGDVDQGLNGSLAFAETPSGGLVVGGDPHNSNGNITLLDEDGVFCWEVDGDPYAEVNDAVALPSCLIVAGENEGSMESQSFVWCYSYSGNLLWEKGYDLGGFGAFDCVASLEDGLLFGGTYSSPEGPICGLLIRTDLYGNEVWRKLISPEEGYQQLYINSVNSGDDGSIIAAGFSPRDHAPRNTNDAVVFLLNSSGDVCDIAFYGKPDQNHEAFNHIMNDPDGGLRLYCRCFGDDYEGSQFLAFPSFNPSE